MAHVLGIIDDDTVDDLKIIKAMRNACAHSRLEIRFATLELRNVLALFFHGDTADLVREIDHPKSLRIFFVTVFIIVSEILRGGDRDAAVAKGQSFIDDMTDALDAELKKHKKRRMSRRHV